MTANEKRNLLVKKALTREKKNQYSQDPNKRIMIEKGYGDCSGTVWYWYNKLFGIDIGGNTEGQINSPKGKRVNLNITQGVPDESKMKKGDLLYFRGTDNSRTEGVGHVEMYIGDGQIFGHGSGIGGTVKNMKTYCTQRFNQSSTEKLKNKGLICVKRFIADDKEDEAMTTAERKEFDTLKNNYTNLQKNYVDLTEKYNAILASLDNIKNAVNKINNPMVYNYIDKNMPSYAVNTVKKLVNKGVLKGTDKGLGLTDDMLRMLVIFDRQGLFG